MQIDEATLYKTIGGRLKARRKQLGKSQSWLAERTGLLRTSITNIESGRQKIPLHTLYAACLALNCELTDILPTAGEVQVPLREEVAIDQDVRASVPPRTARFIRSLVNEPRRSS